MVVIDVNFDVSKDIDVVFSHSAYDFDVELDASYTHISGEYYTGDYEVTPKAEAQTLETANKVLTDNVTIKSVPFFETSNEYGNTVYIASEVY